jgi:hypothetical protein
MEARTARGNERAKLMKTINQEIEQDFERLHETSMQWTEEIWGEQVNDRRFIAYDSPIDFSHSYIYWYENYASLISARSILYIMNEKYAVLSDEATGQWCMTSTYGSPVWQR